MEENKNIDGAVVAAISMALAAYMGDNVHDNESGVLTITYTNKHWNKTSDKEMPKKLPPLWFGNW